MQLNYQIQEGVVRQGKFAFSTGIQAVQKGRHQKATRVYSTEGGWLEQPYLNVLL